MPQEKNILENILPLHSLACVAERYSFSTLHVMWSYKWNLSFIELRMWYQVSYDPRSYEWIYAGLIMCLFTGLNPVEVLNFSGFYIRNCINNWEDRSLPGYTWCPQASKHLQKPACPAVYGCFSSFESKGQDLGQ